MQSKCVFSGSFFLIEVHVRDDGSSPVGDFLSALSAADRRKVDVLFERLACHGRISNDEHFKKIEGTELFEFKRHQIRLIGFYTRNKKFVICHAVRKKKDKHRPQDLNHAEKMKNEFFVQHGNAS